MFFSFCFVSLVGIPVGIKRSALGLKICAIKIYKLIIRKKKKHDKIVLLVETKSNSIRALISKALTNLYISHDNQLASVINALGEYDDMKEEIKNLKISTVY